MSQATPEYKAMKAAERELRKAANRMAHADAEAAKRELRYQERSGQRSVSKLGRYVDDLTRKAAKRVDRPDPRLMSDDQLLAIISAAIVVDKYDWAAHMRPHQQEPSDYSIWLLLCGRGWGKTRTAAEVVRKLVETPNMRVAVIAKDHRALRDVCFEGVSGLIACIPPHLIRKYNKGLGDVGIEMTNGSIIKGYTAGEPDAVRGQAFHFVWGDEFAAWPLHRAEDMLTQIRMTQRESDDCRMILSTTPKRVPHVVKMIEDAKADPRIIVASGRSRDNTALTESWHAEMEKTYGNTRKGRQELEGELVMDNEAALFTFEMIENAKWVEVYDEKRDEVASFPAMLKVVVGVDPSGSKDGDATGISVVGYDKTKTLFVLQNATTKGTPAERYNAACRAAFKWNAREIIVELAYGGDNCIFGLETQWRSLQDAGEIPKDVKCPWIKGSKIKGDKAARAMPVVALYEHQIAHPERRRIWHAPETSENGLASLVEECLMWETTSTKSPNAIDAFAHAARFLMRELGWETQISSPVSPHSTRKPSAARIGGGYRPY